ncbi:MAG: HAD family hydrolase [Bacteroidetes bacterium]|nr:HAD family hydrolase [Bacteroidota bacterium]
MPRIRCLACDLDGTLLTSSNTIPDNVRTAIDDARDLGIRIILASGRTDAFTRSFARQIGSTAPVVSLNGALVKDADGYVLAETPLPRGVVDIAEEIGTQRTGGGLSWSLFNSDGILSLDELPVIPRYLRSDMDEIVRVQDLRHYYDYALLLCAGGSYRAIQQLSLALARKFGRRIKRAMYQSGSGKDLYYLEVGASSVNKSVGLKKAIESIGIDRKETAAIGDYSNDLEMCKFAGVSAAMRNGFKDLKHISDYITKADNDEGGVAEFLRLIVDSRDR